MTDYPLIPRSTSRLIPGQYWSVPMDDGGFACGRVLQKNVEQIPSPTRAFFGGLHAWRSSTPPTSEAIAECGFVAFGIMHIKAITTTGGAILGSRDLSRDKTEMPRLMSSMGGDGTMILEGAKDLRIALRSEWGKYPVVGVWGYDFITQLANRKLAGRAADG